MDTPTTLDACLRAFCDAVLVGDGSGVGGDVFDDIRREVSSFVTQGLADPTAVAAAVTEYLGVPNHLLACADLDFGRLSSTVPLIVQGHSLHLYHILEAFSRTGPQRFAALWLPLVDAANLVNPQHHASLDQARAHLRRQLNAVSTDNTLALPSADPQLDAMMTNILGTFPGLQGMVQQILTTAEAGGGPLGGEAGLANMIAQIQTVLHPVLSQAANSAGTQDPTLQPAINQILTGFTALTGALTRNLDTTGK